MVGNLNSNLAVSWWPHGEPHGSPVTSDLSLNLSERSVRVPSSHFVCATLCSTSMGTNSSNLLPTGGTIGVKDNGGGSKDESV
ncbi:hypothetical protein E2C01_037461 [Portunus trituberculatus]|uniref:Uncharacterized protein n=1 Tax=Portunus trituberculatus TaxID=210409 RepID=A0A5B7FFP4_PORTR|nr:hypothetical protein [Portunus trituberculatus]